MGILINLFTIVALLLSVFMVLVILMQRGTSGGGLGSAMGGGMAESALGADTSNVLSRLTRNVAIGFFVLMFGLYLAQLKMRDIALQEERGDPLPDFREEQNDEADAFDIDSLLRGPEAPELPSDQMPPEPDVEPSEAQPNQSGQ